MESERIKILYVFSQMPYPRQFGVHHRISNIGLALQKYADVTFLYAGPTCEQTRVDATREVFGNLECFFVDEKVSNKGFGRLVHKINYHSPFYFGPKANKDQQKRFAQLTLKSDVVWYHTIKSANYFKCKPEYTILDLDDLNHLKFEYKHEFLDGIRWRLGNNLLIYKWKRKEFSVPHEHNMVLVCSKEDKQYLSVENSFILPNTFEAPSKQYPDHSKDSCRLGFVGSLVYRPNMDGIKWFVKEIWPAVVEKCPQARLRIAGKGGDSLKLHGQNIDVLGFVEDLDSEIETWAGMAVPLTYGGGTRIKILEAFSKKLPVVSTQIGAYGLKAEHGVSLLVADKPSVFAQCCVDLLNNSELRVELATNALELFVTDFSEQRLETDIKEVIGKVMENFR